MFRAGALKLSHSYNNTTLASVEKRQAWGGGGGAREADGEVPLLYGNWSILL